LTFNLADGTHYGWAQVSANVDADSATFTLIDWAYQDVPNAEIKAGEGAVVPEPSALALLALGAAGVAAVRRFRKQRTDRLL
jgi:hypothetical protein